MIEHLSKTHELVHFRNNTHILIRNNIQSEAYPPHWHNEVEIVLVRSGKLQIRCGGIDYSMQAGDILIINPASIHEIRREAKGSRIYLQADLSGFAFLQELRTAFSVLAPAALITPQTFPDSYPMFLDSYRRIHNLYFGDDVYDMDFEAMESKQLIAIDHNVTAASLPFLRETQIYSHLLNFIASAAINVRESSQKDMAKNSSASGSLARNNQAIQDACNIVLTEFSEPLSLGSVAERVGFSKFHFERVFKENMCMTFYQYVTNVRISHSKTLLADPSLSITDIAVSCGFSSSSSFSRTFRQETGNTPSDFRNMRQSLMQACRATAGKDKTTRRS